MMLARPGLADGRLEREELLVAQLARADVDRRLVEPALGQAVADHVLAGRDDAVGAGPGPGARGCRRQPRTAARYGSSP